MPQLQEVSFLAGANTAPAGDSETPTRISLLRTGTRFAPACVVCSDMSFGWWRIARRPATASLQTAERETTEDIGNGIWGAACVKL